MGEEFHEVLNQSSETWHDNAPWDAVCDKQSLIKSEYDELKSILSNSDLEKPIANSSSVGMGCTVYLDSNQIRKSIFIAGDWSIRTGTHIKEAFVVSARSPIAQACLGKYVGDNTLFGKITSFQQVEAK